MNGGEWWYTLDGKTPADRRRSLKRAPEIYHARFDAEIPQVKRMFRIGRTIYLSYEKPASATVVIEPEPEPEPESEEWDPAIEQLQLLPLRDLEALYMHAVVSKGDVL